MNTDKIYAESIAKDYAPKNTSKITALKKLDYKAKRPAEIFTYTFGVAFTLIFGTGLCLTLRIIGPDTTGTMIVGIAIGLLGIIGLGVNYPIYKIILERN